jgi:hypothetical protein
MAAQKEWVTARLPLQKNERTVPAVAGRRIQDDLKVRQISTGNGCQQGTSVRRQLFFA